MTNTHVVFVKNEKESEELQKKLFAHGMGWGGHPNSYPIHIEERFLIIRGNILTWQDDFKYVSRKIKEGVYTCLNACDIDVSTLPGAAPPVVTYIIDGEEYTEDELRNAIAIRKAIQDHFNL